MPGAELRVGLHRIALDVARLRPDHVEQPHLAPVGDLVAEDRFDGVLPVVVLDLADRLEAEGPGRHVRHLAQHEHRLPGVWRDAARAPARGHRPEGMMFGPWNDERPRAGGALQWAIQDSNLGPLPYQRSALTD